MKLSYPMEKISPGKYYWIIGCLGFNGKHTDRYQFKPIDEFNFTKCFKALEQKIWWKVKPNEKDTEYF